MNIDEIIKQVAKVHNSTPEEVYAEMQIALDVDGELIEYATKIPHDIRHIILQY